MSPPDHKEREVIMPEINEHCEFVIISDKLEMTTQTNGDRIVISGINLDANQAAALAYLVNCDSALKVEIKRET